jgi:DNA invertase Pin-like site-specific DNA recombinase
MIGATQASVYARVSSERQAEENTIESQLAVLYERVVADGLELPEALVFVDDGYSGSTLVRPALERLRDLVAMGGLDRLYVHSPDRLARKYALQVLLIDEFRRGGVEVVFLNRQLGETPEDELLLQVQGMMVEGQLGKLRRGLGRLIDGYAEGLIEKGEFEPRVARLRGRIDKLEEQAQRLADEAALEAELRLIVGRLEEFREKVKDGLEEAAWSTRRNMIRALVKRVEVGEGEVNVVFRVDQNPFDPSPERGSSQHRRERRCSDTVLIFRPGYVPLCVPDITARFLPRGSREGYSFRPTRSGWPFA